MISGPFLVPKRSKNIKKAALEFKAFSRMLFWRLSAHLGVPLGSHLGTRNHSKIVLFTPGPPRGVQEAPRRPQRVILELFLVSF